ncbi:pyridine nucleotide-disulfide oxidoreductase family protein [Mycolicibacterium hassiacum DSM 44199]|jgi:sulfide:quinone oxidoreductase|uniref:Pyridine nucleotide-disulfide oxidoreductase family protein n=1 Tax=Mycolicibacterium hassiacum (strain DSM 44199 / CIP 105218 / JCM 12690 / 3849) TaxID=1122247 RepID=K5BFI3_MYCHD|nr:FAD/NAD(P)-binding oxidoreductase [Mycolicibacterium hassiacum]EKF23176.1 pyridine nucleotide-disulfide oxidoreductase family protein [Mycolicibacterium hassiacum DSM 44199]MBX5488742.1 NAD(P)/FAD-dependent oxidoreductase [Mycolicibacterium hassiacum]MDA4085569.1 FAD-dependent pyridine nucleotide-disulfide oxidoreductase [Mycolicibacterium hassiacum DSM 44199]PZN20170.1 MAG: NAD(P)/FAD-dependent oxidoreductase [Mycolicibacterium hassiacum]VCT89647.1 Sulfide dehydrogenase [flavocytochrome c]
MTTAKHRVLIVGGGTAGITVAARLLRKGHRDVAVIDPSDMHYYQALWTLVGGGQASAAQTVRPEASVMPKGATWIRAAAETIDPENNTVGCADGTSYEYDVLVVCPGIQLDWDRTEGLSETLGRNGVSSNYRFDLAPRTWQFIRDTRSGTAVFAMPSGPIKCAGAPQKIAYLACDYWRREGVLKNIDVHLVLPTPRTFGIPEIADSLDAIIADYGIHLHTESEVTAVDAAAHKVSVTSLGASGTDTTLPFDVMHIAPRQSAPDWIKASPLSTGDANGYVEIDKHTMQHVRYPNVFALGDAGSTPNSKTGAAIRKQAPVVVDNVDAFLAGRPLQAYYDGYASCPIVVSSREMLLAEFDYSMRMKPTFGLLDPAKPHRPYWFLKKYGLPFMYWNLMLKGLA